MAIETEVAGAGHGDFGPFSEPLGQPRRSVPVFLLMIPSSKWRPWRAEALWFSPQASLGAGQLQACSERGSRWPGLLTDTFFSFPNLEPKAETQPAYKNLKILYAVLAFLALLLVASLAATVLLYTWENACPWLHGKPVPCNSTDNSTLLALKTEKDHLEKTSASYQALQRKYRLVYTLLSEGWRLHNWNIYYFSSETKSWEKAQQSCESKNSNLVSVTSREEQEFLGQAVKDGHWIGLTDAGSEGVWHWVDGTPYNASTSPRFWASNQPDNWDYDGKGKGENCAHLISGNRGSWNDANCDLPYRWICKVSL
ncbi:C-type lectin domain family 4 member K-like [Monodelphis domestica]|uniref:C-type lectin domain family 4 member K-like n=1 Tax=Monodelphis domestica TaxID=13616 RepID=UPI0024E2445B|nr:C-type lectin domain family 4 member K-like [Monodelphis domestica]